MPGLIGGGADRPDASNRHRRRSLSGGSSSSDGRGARRPRPKPQQASTPRVADQTTVRPPSAWRDGNECRRWAQTPRDDAPRNPPAGSAGPPEQARRPDSTRPWDGPTRRTGGPIPRDTRRAIQVHRLFVARASSTSDRMGGRCRPAGSRRGRLRQLPNRTGRSDLACHAPRKCAWSARLSNRRNHPLTSRVPADRPARQEAIRRPPTDEQAKPTSVAGEPPGLGWPSRDRRDLPLGNAGVAPFRAGSRADRPLPTRPTTRGPPSGGEVRPARCRLRAAPSSSRPVTNPIRSTATPSALRSAPGYPQLAPCAASGPKTTAVRKQPAGEVSRCGRLGSDRRETNPTRSLALQALRASSRAECSPLAIPSDRRTARRPATNETVQPAGSSPSSRLGSGAPEAHPTRSFATQTPRARRLASGTPPAVRPWSPCDQRSWLGHRARAVGLSPASRLGSGAPETDPTRSFATR